MRDNDELDELEAEIDAADRAQPGYGARVEQLTEIVRITTALWRRREELGLAVEEIATRSGLTLDEVESIEDNAVDAPFESLARYAAAVGLRIDVKVSAA